MDWISRYQLVLLDLDGLLVNTEELHYQAYCVMCQHRGCHLKLSFRDYCGIAHHSAEGLEQMVYTQFPALREKEPRWSVLYAEKKKAYIELLRNGTVELMPGAERFLLYLEKAGVKRCVVTNSACDLAEIICQKIPILRSIPHWFTRETYTHPKPHPECYQKAIVALASQGDKVIGFEDSPRGLEALRGTAADRVLIASKDHPCLPIEGDDKFMHFESLTALSDN